MVENGVDSATDLFNNAFRESRIKHGTIENRRIMLRYYAI